MFGGGVGCGVWGMESWKPVNCVGFTEILVSRSDGITMVICLRCDGFAYPERGTFAREGWCHCTRFVKAREGEKEEADSFVIAKPVCCWTSVMVS